MAPAWKLTPEAQEVKSGLAVEHPLAIGNLDHICYRTQVWLHGACPEAL